MTRWQAWLLQRIHRDPYLFYGLLRRATPLFHVPALGCWIVSRADDVAFVLREPLTFSSSVMSPADPYLLGADAPRHTRVRRALMRGLTPSSFATLQSVAEKTAQRVVEHIDRHRPIDLIAELAAPLPAAVMASLLDTDPDDAPRLATWSRAVVDQASRRPGTAAPPDAGARSAELDRFVETLVHDRASSSSDDLVSTMLSGASEERLTIDEARSVVRLLIIAGNETTARLIGHALQALIHHRRLLQRNDDAIAGLVEETLRYDPPVQFVLRRTTRPVRIAGGALPADATVMALLGSAGRDSKHIARAHRFDPTREASPHVAFGAGPHRCPGAMIARMEAQIALTAVRRAFPSIQLAARRPPPASAFQLRGPSELWVST